MSFIRNLADNQATGITFVIGQIQPVMRLASRIARVGQSGSEIQRAGSAAAVSRIELHRLCQTLQVAQEVRTALALLAGNFAEIEDQFGDIVTVAVIGQPTVRITAGAYAYQGTTYSHLLVCEMDVERQP